MVGRQHIQERGKKRNRGEEGEREEEEGRCRTYPIDLFEKVQIK